MRRVALVFALCCLAVPAQAEDNAANVDVILSSEDILAIQDTVRRVPVADPVVSYAVRLVRATRLREKDAPDFVKEWVRWGAGPRAAQYLILGAKARALVAGRTYVSTDDVKAVAHPVLRHRVLTNFQAEAEGITPDTVVDRLLTAPRHPARADARNGNDIVWSSTFFFAKCFKAVGDEQFEFWERKASFLNSE